MKKELLKHLRSDMKSARRGNIGSMLGGAEPRKVVVEADSEKGLLEGLSKAEEIMKHKMGDKKESSCSGCGKSSCDC